MAIPASKGWKTDDWHGWFECLLGMAVGHLTDLKKGKGDAAVHVHETRKILKRLRTGTRLLEDFATKGALRDAKIALRDAGRLLSGSRDGTVRLQTFDSLLEMSGRKLKGGLVAAREKLEREAKAAAGTAGQGAPEALVLLKEMALTEEAWRLRGKNDVKGSLARILDRGREYFHTVDEVDGEEFHELRKRVKDLYYSLGALPGEATGARKRVLTAIHVFEDSLGLLNDLTVLMEWFKDHGLGHKKCPEFWKMADPAVKEFRRIVLEEGVVLDELAERGKYRKVFLAKE